MKNEMTTATEKERNTILRKLFYFALHFADRIELQTECKNRCLFVVWKTTKSKNLNIDIQK